jgi:hypothetical protein
MNAPLRARETISGAGLRAFAFFHLNLAFSSIEEERRDEVVARCYWPLLDLAARAGPIGIEASAYTLEEIARRDPSWIARARELLGAGKMEWIGSGYSQMIGPLVPARVTAENLRLGNETYAQILGARPRLALLNEQAYAAGLVGLYLDAGYHAVLMDWENPSAHHPEWDPETQYLPQRALGADGRSIALIWSNTMLFQQLQRLAHGDIGIEAYLQSVARRARKDRALCLYASDAEVFDFRPGRFKTEEKLSGGEWRRIEEALCRAASDGGLIKPSDVLEWSERPGAGQTLSLESAECPVPVKKQRKYNLARWAVTGRDNLGINAACQRVYQGMLAGNPDWKELCYLWASDFRTHLTEKRWEAYCERLAQAEAKWAKALPPMPAVEGGSIAERFFTVETPTLVATLDRRRGLALAKVHFKNQAQPSLGGLPHGFFEEIALAADWYTGDCVFEAPGEHKLTDLEWCDARSVQKPNGDVLVFAKIDTAKGPIRKTLRFSASRPEIAFDLEFDWSDWGKGVLRLGHFTLLPGAFDRDRLTLASSNGGGRETFPLHGRTVEHGAPVSFLVSSSHGFAMTEGWAEIGDGQTGLKVEVDRSTAPLLGLLSHRVSGGKLFCQIQLSALELDDTRKPGAYRPGPRRCRFSVAAL